MNTLSLVKDIARNGTPAAPQPTVAAVFPFDPKMTPKAGIEQTIKCILGNAEKELLTRHAADEAMPVIKRLRQALRGLNYSTHRRSVAVWVSAAMSGTTYMDFAVEEQLFIDRPFHIRDLADRELEHHLVEGHVSSSDGCSYIIIEKAVKTISKENNL